MHGKYLVGVDIGGTKTAVVLSLAPPAILDRVEFPTCAQELPDDVLRRIVDEIRKMLSTHQLDSSHLKSIGVSCGSPLDPVNGVILGPPNLPTWQHVPITSILSKEFGVECHLENDANAGALAEHLFGAGRGARNLIFLTMGTGLGAGLVLDGRLYRGTSYAAGEVGHIRLSRSGPVGYNKIGSAEGWASGAGMPRAAVKTLKDALRRGEKTILATALQGDLLSLSAREIWHASQDGDGVAQRVIHNTGKKLGEAMAILVDLFNPDCIVVGGLALRMGDAVLGPARTTVNKEALRSSAAVCKIAVAELGETIGDVAALCIAMGAHQ